MEARVIVRRRIVVVVIHVLIALRTLILEPRAAFAQHAKIMVRELKKIFGLDAVARELGIARHALVFFKQLRGVAALAIVLPVTGLATAEVPASLPTTTAPAAALSVIDQMPTSLRSSR